MAFGCLHMFWVLDSDNAQLGLDWFQLYKQFCVRSGFSEPCVDRIRCRKCNVHAEDRDLSPMGLDNDQFIKQLVKTVSAINTVVWMYVVLHKVRAAMVMIFKHILMAVSYNIPQKKGNMFLSDLPIRKNTVELKICNNLPLTPLPPSIIQPNVNGHAQTPTK
ncbi:hypothetical protein L208DRAFT_1556210 [Tricholoma matsutake]|nr:hypothetical protein L208DRAFT_1556210 [Tricholoma matsutake 945]